MTKMQRYQNALEVLAKTEPFGSNDTFAKSVNDTARLALGWPLTGQTVRGVGFTTKSVTVVGDPCRYIAPLVSEETPAREVRNRGEGE